MKLSFRWWTSPQRFARILIFFGVPALCLEFIEIPRSAWGTVLVLVAPATIAALFVVTMIEQLLSFHFVESEEAGLTTFTAGGPENSDGGS